MARHRYTNEEIEKWREERKKLMYANPDDSRIMVPKASGFGITFNWANPMSWVVFVLIIAAILVIRWLIVMNR